MHRCESAVGTPAARMTSLAKALEPSRTAASLPGPKVSMPTSRRASATPATSGASGPMTTRSTLSCCARSTTATGEAGSAEWSVAIDARPGLPGAAWSSVTDGSAARARPSACSRPPEPNRRIFTGVSLALIHRQRRPDNGSRVPRGYPRRRQTRHPARCIEGPRRQPRLCGHPPQLRDTVATIGSISQSGRRPRRSGRAEPEGSQ